MRKWLCRHGLHAWDAVLTWELWQITVRRRCAREGCGAVMVTYVGERAGK